MSKKNRNIFSNRNTIIISFIMSILVFVGVYFVSQNASQEVVSENQTNQQN